MNGAARATAKCGAVAHLVVLVEVAPAHRLGVLLRGEVRHVVAKVGPKLASHKAAGGVAAGEKGVRAAGACAPCAIVCERHADK